MSTLATAFVLAWTAVAAYVSWLGLQNRRLAQRLDALEAAASDESDAHHHSKAA
jgi:CcmD family protein